MYPQFEQMEFAWQEAEGALEGEMERAGRYPRNYGRAGTKRAGGAPRKPHRYPYRGPYFGGGGWWPYGANVVAPFPVDTAEPALEPADQAEPPDSEPMQGETPPTLGATLARMEPALRPAYQRIGSLRQALQHRQAIGPGLYYLEFDVNGQRRAYSGQTKDLRTRLQKHSQCASMMGLNPALITTYVAAGLRDDADRRAREKSIHDKMFNFNSGVLTNQRRELEAEFWGELGEHHGSCQCGRCGGARQAFELMEFGA
jgi:hypothetical protein